jgi:hypothetical protein
MTQLAQHPGLSVQAQHRAPFCKTDPAKGGDTAYLFSVETTDEEARPVTVRFTYRVERRATGFAGRQWDLYRRPMTADGVMILNGEWDRVADDLPTRDSAFHEALHDAQRDALLKRAMRAADATGQPLFTLSAPAIEERPWSQWQEEERPPRIPTPSIETRMRWAAGLGLGTTAGGRCDTCGQEAVVAHSH